LAVIIALSVSAPGHAQTQEEVDTLIRDLPPDAKAFIDRNLACHHLAGEGGDNDAERDEEIAKMMRDYRCDALADDATALRKKYSAAPKILKAIDASDSVDAE
jgi:hypothetical protein